MIKTLKKIFNFAGKEKSNIHKSIVVNFINAIFSMLEIMSIYLIISKVLEGNKDAKNSLYALILLVIGIIGKTCTQYFSQLQQTHSSFFMTANKRIHIADKLKRVPMGYFNENSLGEITGVSTTVLELVEMIAARVLINALGGIITSVIFTILILIFDWRIGLIVIIATIIYLAVSSLTEKKSSKLFPIKHKSQATMVSSILEYVQGMSIVKSYNLNGKGDKTLQDALEHNCQSNLNIEKTFTPYHILQSLSIQFASIAIILVSIIFHLNGTMSLINALMMIIISFSVF